MTDNTPWILDLENGLGIHTGHGPERLRRTLIRAYRKGARSAYLQVGHQPAYEIHLTRTAIGILRLVAWARRERP